MTAEERAIRIATLDVVESGREDCRWSLRCYLRDGRVFRVPTSAFKRLAPASIVALRDFRILFDGMGVHWPTLDEDVSVRGMLRFGSLERDAPRKPLSLRRCAACGEPWAEPIEFYRHADHPKGKCTETASGPTIRTLLAHVADDVGAIRGKLLDIDQVEGRHLSTALGVAGALAGLTELLEFLRPYAGAREPTDLVQQAVRQASGTLVAAGGADALAARIFHVSPRCAHLIVAYEGAMGADANLDWAIGKFTVRVWDGMDGCWTDVLADAPAEVALACWAERTDGGTKRIRFDEIDYYRIFPAQTRMHYDGSRGREMFRDDHDEDEGEEGGTT